MTLLDLQPSQLGIIEELGGDSHVKSRLMEMGISENAEIRLIRKMPFKGPLTFKIRSSLISIRISDASKIIVRLHEK